MDKKNNLTKKQIYGGVVFLLALCAVFWFVYKAQLNESLDERNHCTLMWEHKVNGLLELSKDKPSVTQVFTCTVPKLKVIQIQCKGKKINPNT